MSLILKEIDLPSKNQSIVIEIKPNGRCSTMKIEKGECYELTTKGEAKAIQIPTPHGRLVDANDIKAKCINEVFESMGTVAITDPYPDDEWADDICDVPTILEAEE